MVGSERGMAYPDGYADTASRFLIDVSLAGQCFLYDRCKPRKNAGSIHFPSGTFRPGSRFPFLRFGQAEAATLQTSKVFREGNNNSLFGFDYSYNTSILD